MSLTARFSCLSDYDPDALSVEQARAFIRSQFTAANVPRSGGAAQRAGSRAGQ
jgi:hypothetical protein